MHLSRKRAKDVNKRKKMREIKTKSLNVKSLIEATKRAKLGGETKIRSASAYQDTFLNSFFPPPTGGLALKDDKGEDSRD